MSVFNGNDIRLGGRFKNASLNLVHLKTDRQYTDSKPWCLDNSKIEVCTSNEIITATINNSVLTPHPVYSQTELNWGAMRTAPLSTTGVITCLRQ